MPPADDEGEDVAPAPTERDPAAIGRRAEESPESVTADDVLALLEAGELYEYGHVLHVFLDQAAGSDVEALAQRVVPALEGDLSERTSAARLLATVADQRPSAATPVVPELAERATAEDPNLGEIATSALRFVAAEHPDAVLAADPPLSDLLRSDYFDRREEATLLASSLAEAAPGDVAPAVPALLAVVAETESTTPDPDALGGPGGGAGAPGDPGDGPQSIQQVVGEQHLRRSQTRATAARTVLAVARGAPADLTDRVPQVLDAIDPASSDPPAGILAEAVGLVALEDPSSGSVAVETLADLLATTDFLLNAAKAARSLALVAEVHPQRVADEVAPVADAVVDLLDSEDARVRAPAATLLSYLAEHELAAVESATHALVDCLDAEDVACRSSAATALGYVGGQDALDALRHVASGDPDESVREAARGAIERIEAGSGE